MIDVEKCVSVETEGARIPKISRILFVLRNDVDYLKTVDYVINLVNSIPDSKVYVLYTVDIDPVPMEEKVEREFYRKLREEGERIVEIAMNRLKSAGVDVELYDMHFGIAAERILKAERELQPDLIIMGARGLSTFKKMLLGSVFDKVLDRAKIPVMIIR